MDVLSDVMQTVRLQSHLYGRLELTAPWGMRIDAPDRPSFFVVTRGSCWLEMGGGEKPVPLAGGDFVFLPRARPHILRDAPDTPAVSIEEIFGDCEHARLPLHYGGGGMPVSIVCGCFTFEDGGRNPLVESLPPMIHVRADHTVQWLEMTLQFVAAEAASLVPGAETVANRLADILFVHAVRAHIASGGDRVSGWLRALTDPQIGAAMRLIHESPQTPWTVASLASAAAMSRSAFAARFATVVGETPLRYLTAWRMRKASNLLKRESKISMIAKAVGYETETAFGKAFRKHAGMTPGTYRRRAHDPEALEVARTAADPDPRGSPSSRENP
jgi:AraC-like DNA-binding protein